MCAIFLARTLAILWFGSGIFLAPVLLGASLLGMGWSVTTGRGDGRPELVKVCLGGIVLAGLMALGIPVWLSEYAQ